MTLDNVQTELVKRAKSELLPDEALLWVGRPKKAQRTAFGGKNKVMMLSIVVGLQIFLVLLGGVFFAVSNQTEPDAVTETSPVFLVSIVSITILILVLVSAILALFLWMRNAKNAVYAITDRRALVIFGESVQSYGERDIQFIERKMHKDDTGDVIFQRKIQTQMGYYGGGVVTPRSHEMSIGFFGIEDPHEVEELMLQTFRPDSSSQKRKHDENRDENDPYFDHEEDRFAANET